MRPIPVLGTPVRRAMMVVWLTNPSAPKSSRKWAPMNVAALWTTSALPVLILGGEVDE
jgi:hypothetical protein